MAPPASAPNASKEEEKSTAHPKSLQSPTANQSANAGGSSNNSVAAASRENFLRRLELQQQQQKQREEHLETLRKLNGLSDSKEDQTSDDGKVAFGDGEKQSSTVAEHGGKMTRGNGEDGDVNTKTVSSPEKEVTPRSAELLRKQQESDNDAIESKESPDKSSSLFLDEIETTRSCNWESESPLGRSSALAAYNANTATNQDVMNYLSNCCGLAEPSSLDLQNDLDSSSLEFLKGLASMAAFSPSASTSTGLDDAKKANVTFSPKTSVEGKTVASSSRVPDSTKNVGGSTLEPDSVQNRMLDFMERQQVQMQELHARLDALGGMMAQMDQDVRYLRSQHHKYAHSTNIGSGGHLGGASGAANGISEYERSMVRLENLHNAMGQYLQAPSNGLVGLVSTPSDANCWRKYFDRSTSLPYYYNVVTGESTWEQPRSFNINLPPGWEESVDSDTSKIFYYNKETKETTWVRPTVPLPTQSMQRPQNIPPMAQPLQPPAGARLQDPPLHRGIFFPLFAYLFNFIANSPQRLRTLLESTGPGRVYVHIRNQAIERRAFANVDFSALMKLMVMVLVITGKMGGSSSGSSGGGGNSRRRTQAANNNNAGRAGRDEGGGGEAYEEVMAYVYEMLDKFTEFWRGHRVHTMVLAAIIAFFIQSGLMSFFYEVIWVEREELLNVYLGRQQQDEGDEFNAVVDNAVGGGAGVVAPNGDVVRPAGGVEANIAVANGVQRQANPAEGNRHEHVRPAGGMIRRGPNGGFFHDVQCLIFSFLLSLIPAWKPEEAAQPEEEQPTEAEADAGEAAGNENGAE